MKKKIFKFSIILLCMIVALSMVACSYVSNVWDYVKGNFDSLYEDGNGSGSEPTPTPPPPPSGDISVNVGNAQTQTGGLADAISASKPSVVETYTTYLFEKDGEQYYLYTQGSGVILQKDSDGLYIVTNTQLVLDGADQGEYVYNDMYVTVRFCSGAESKAEIKYRDSTADVALLFVDKTNLDEHFDMVTVASPSKNISKGERVFAVGNPFTDGSFGLSATAGVISTIGREMNIGENRLVSLIQTDTAVNSGNTGGGLFNGEGKLIGIVNGKIVATGVEGLGFALPIEKVLDILHGANYLLGITV